MLSSLGRNGLHHRYHQFYPHRRHALYGTTRNTVVSTPSSNTLHSYRRATHSKTFFLPSRSFSTPPTTVSETKDASSPPAIPSASVKAKVELRPGPIKPPIAPSGSHPSRVTKVSTTNSSPQLHSTSPTTKPPNKVAETKKEDLKRAYIHGVLARPPPGAGKIATLWHQVKELFKFYFRGLKLVVSHRKQVNAIQARVKAGGEPLSRWESRFIQTNNNDLARLVPFVAIVLLLEEVIPLIVLYAPGMLPSTCVLASQRERIDSKRREKQRAYAESMRDIFSEVHKAGPTVLASSLPSATSGIALCGLLSLSTWGPEFRRKRKVERHMKSVVADDLLLVKEGLGDRLTHPELLEALEERGVVTNGLGTTKMKARLRWWLTTADRSDEGTPVSRRIVLASQSALGQFQLIAVQ